VQKLLAFKETPKSFADGLEKDYTKFTESQ
jgi:hypothetical protein